MTAPLSGESAEETAFLEGLAWVTGTCACCRAELVLTTEADHIATASNSGFSIRVCRSCLLRAVRRDQAAALARGRAWSPRLPELVVPLAARGG